MPCITPYIATNKPQYSGAYHIPVRCGTCPDCLAHRRREWLFRLEIELNRATSAYFVTYTYDEEHVPEDKDTGYYILHYPDMQKYWKRVRKAQPDANIKHITVGEYGTIGKRPHYHSIVLNADEDILYDKWTAGMRQIDTCETKSMMYVLKYTDKQLDPYHNIKKTHWDLTVPKPFRRMSQNLGESFVLNTDGSLNKMGRKILKQEVYTVCLDDGTKMPLPRYYVKLVHGDTRKYKPPQRTKNVQKQFIKQELRYYQGAEIYEEALQRGKARFARHNHKVKSKPRKEL